MSYLGMAFITFVLSIGIAAWLIRGMMKAEPFKKDEDGKIADGDDVGTSLVLFATLFGISFFGGLVWFLYLPILVLAIPSWFIYKWAFGLTTKEVFDAIFG